MPRLGLLVCMCIMPLPRIAAFRVCSWRRFSSLKTGRPPVRRAREKHVVLAASGQTKIEGLEELQRKLWNPAIQVDWESFYKTVQDERSYYVEPGEIEGQIPPDFAATIFRNGPGRFDRGGKRFEHVLDGDGHIIKFVVDGAQQRAHVANRYVRTPEYLEEERTGEILFRSTFGTQSPRLSDNIFNLKLTSPIFYAYNSFIHRRMNIRKPLHVLQSAQSVEKWSQ